MSERTGTTCPTCGAVIQPDETGMIEAVEIVPAPGFGAGAHDTAEGMHALFHAGCFPDGDPRWRRLPTND